MLRRHLWQHSAFLKFMFIAELGPWYFWWRLSRRRPFTQHQYINKPRLLSGSSLSPIEAQNLRFGAVTESTPLEMAPS